MDGLAFDRNTEQLGFVQFMEGDPDVFGPELTFVLTAIVERGWRVAQLHLSAIQHAAWMNTSDTLQVAQVVFVAKRDSGELRLSMESGWGAVIKWGP